MIDKNCIRQVLGCLIKNPKFLSEKDKYNLTIDDFSNNFEKNIFVAIDGLYYQGAGEITVADIENYISTNPAAKQMFDQQKGIDYLLDAIELSKIDNFNYYYKKLKKINLLRDLKKMGFDTSEFYDENFLNPDSFEINGRFEDLEISDITERIKRRILGIESEYGTAAEIEASDMSEEIEDLYDFTLDESEVGLPIQGAIYNEVIGGACLGAMTIRSAASGVGKTRSSVADAAYLAFPIRYDWTKHKWVVTGNNQKVLYIMTEQSIIQIKKMVRSYVTGINEDRFKYNDFSLEERTVIEQSKQILGRYGKNLDLVKMPNPTIETIKLTVREHCIMNDIKYVFYDYIFIGPALLGEFKGFQLRNDEVLLMFSTALKDLAQELNVAVFTSTQVNANADSTKDIRNEASLAGSRSIINKADNGCIISRPTQEELELLDIFIKQSGKQPNAVSDVFKVRNGRWTQVRIWSYIDLGTMRREDLFITNGDLQAIEDFEIHGNFGMVDFGSEDVEYANLLNKKG